jgi:hypothetical protein
MAALNPALRRIDSTVLSAAEGPGSANAPLAKVSVKAAAKAFRVAHDIGMASFASKPRDHPVLQPCAAQASLRRPVRRPQVPRHGRSGSMRDPHHSFTVGRVLNPDRAILGVMEVVNGYACATCTDVSNAKRNIDPQRPKDGPQGVNAREKPERSEDQKAQRGPAVTLSGAPADVAEATAPEKPREEPYVPGAAFDLKA